MHEVVPNAVKNAVSAATITFTRNFRAKYGMTPTAYKQTKV